MTFLLWSVLRGLPWLFGIAVAIVFGFFFAVSLGSDEGFVLMLQGTRLIVPTAGLQPRLPATGLLDVIYLVLIATCIGIVTLGRGWIQKALLSITVVVVLGVVVQVLLRLAGYRFVPQIEM